MRTPILICVMLVLASTPVSQAQQLPSAFTGKDLSGWKVPDNNRWWTAANGVITTRSGPQKEGSILWTKTTYKDFVMQFDFKMGEGTVDTGIFVRNEKEQIQIGNSGSMKRDMTGSPYISGTGYPVQAKGVQRLLKAKDWNTMTIVAVGKNYSVWLNGKHILAYDSPSAIKQGPIGIQLHPNRRMTAFFRNIRIAKLN